MNATQMNLADVAIKVAMMAAREWFAQHSEARYEWTDLAECIKANVKIRFPQAINDAKDAIDCGMVQIAEKTFQASMALAGIDAAKESAILV